MSPVDHTDGAGWRRPDLVRDYLSIPGVVEVRTGEQLGEVTIVVLNGCHGIARILTNSGALPPGLRLREEELPPDARA